MKTKWFTIFCGMALLSVLLMITITLGAIATEVTCDDGDACFSNNGIWKSPSNPNQYCKYNNDMRFGYSCYISGDCQPNNDNYSVFWQPTLTPGSYAIYAYISRIDSATPHTQSAKYYLRCPGDSAATAPLIATINQAHPFQDNNDCSDNARFASLGTHYFDSSCYVELRAWTNESAANWGGKHHVIFADAMKFVQIESTDTTSPSVVLQSPINGSIVTSSPIQVLASAQDSGGSGLNRVEFHASYNNKTNLIATDTTAPFSINWTIPSDVPSGSIVFSVIAFDNAGNRSQNNNQVYSTITYEAPAAPCSIPYFSQIDSRWRNHPLRTSGACSSSCNTIGSCGCTLTSTAMVFKQYGANTNPAALSDCMGNKACPFYWATANNCSDNKATFAARSSFSWSLLDREINQNRKPVVLGMRGYVNGRTRTHWVLVIAGHGNSPANYIVHDPGTLNGRSVPLSTLTSRGYGLETIATYHGGSLCPTSIAAFPATSIPESVQADTKVASSSFATEHLLENEIDVSGWVYPYRISTDTEMIVQIQIESSMDKIVDMKVWTDSMPNTSWQEYYPFVALPISDEVYVQLRTESGEISKTWTTTSHPTSFPPDSLNSIYLPSIFHNK